MIFNPDSYIESAIVQKEIISRLIERTSLINFIPEQIIDIGAGIGLSSRPFMDIFPNAKVNMYDKSITSLNKSIIQSENFYKVCGDFASLPFKDDSFDLVFSASALHWNYNIGHTIQEIFRILKPSGLLLFSTFGKDTLKEYKDAWAMVDSNQHVNEFFDMHNLGDLLYKVGLKDPVMDSEKIVIQYDSVRQIQLDLKNIGSFLMQRKRGLGLTSKGKMQNMYKSYEELKGPQTTYPLTYEVIYGHAWKTL